MNVWVLILPLAALLIIYVVLLAFIVLFPRGWSTFVDKEYALLRRYHLAPAFVAEQLKRIEKGPVQTLAVAATIIALTIFITLLFMRYVLGYRI